MYEDPEFPATAESLGPARDADAVTEDDVIWLRPHEIVEPLENYPQATLFGDENTEYPGDVNQGKLGDCYLVGAMASVAVHPDDIIERLFVEDDFNETGKVSTNFYKDGEWETVTVDTRLPCDKETRRPIFAKNRDPNELWSALLEKAYAKLHGNYAALNGGSVSEALVRVVVVVACTHVKIEIAMDGWMDGWVLLICHHFATAILFIRIGDIHEVSRNVKSPPPHRIL